MRNSVARTFRRTAGQCGRWITLASVIFAMIGSMGLAISLSLFSMMVEEGGTSQYGNDAWANSGLSSVW